jgi:hypothetical protein
MAATGVLHVAYKVRTEGKKWQNASYPPREVQKSGDSSTTSAPREATKTYILWANEWISVHDDLITHFDDQKVFYVCEEDIVPTDDPLAPAPLSGNSPRSRKWLNKVIC